MPVIKKLFTSANVAPLLPAVSFQQPVVFLGAWDLETDWQSGKCDAREHCDNTSKGVTDVVRRVRSLWETDFRADF